MSDTGNSCTEEFRRNAVDLLRSSGRPIKQVARELGVNVNSLRTWRNRSLLGQSGGKGIGAAGDKDEPESRPRTCLMKSNSSAAKTNISGVSARS